MDREYCLCDVVYCISSPVPNLELKPRFGEGSCILGSKWAQEIKPHSFFFFFFKLLIYFCLHWVFDAARRLSLVVESGGSSLVVGHGLLIAMAPLVAGHGL